MGTPTPLPARIDLIVIENSDQVIPIKLLKADGTLRDMTGFDAEIDVRSALGASPALFTLSTDNGRIAFGTFGSGTNTYNMELFIPHTVSEALTNWGVGVWDCLIANGSGQYRIWEGDAVFSRRSTEF